MARFLQYVLAAKVVRPLSTFRFSSRLFGIYACALCAVFMLGCEEIEEPKPWIRVERPQMLFTDTTLLDSYDKGVLNWRLKTAYLERWADKEIVTVRPVFVDIYDSVGERVAFLRADSGSLDMKFTYVYAYGHVYALTPKGASVRADSLLWNKKDNLVKTASYVRVVSEDGDVLQGVGFESDAKLDNWKILSNVTGIFQDAAKRMKDEDKKQAEAQRLNNPPSSSSQAVSSQSAKPSRPAAQNPVAPRSATPQSAAPRPVPQSASSSPANPTPTAAPTSQKSAHPHAFMRPHGLFAKPNAGNP
ncbi:LPS export ABC transporter periplasmic protein LptC [Fibrobacter sp.]|uniref:LPS export ABC transporter periplasmic protein LptC n=1 Tax=Fibrobacter sp. TaxID=35828 RepID=UPI0025C0F2A8|nr:LPS export ABC transporter periplasmic protein LptC [Fibrobacter sp.]